MTYQEAVAYLSRRAVAGEGRGRERFRALLSRLGDPQEHLRAVHVAGTNGKGSTCTFVSAVLQAAGYRVGTYLSPYVFDLRERVQVGGELIGRDDFAAQVGAIRPHVEALAQTSLGDTTEFELKTAVAFRFFAEQKVDFAVIEVGIGGRLDATNVIAPPLAAVITSIGLDHQKLLGETLGEIAGEKAGIIKAGTPGCVCAVPPGEAQDVIWAKAAREDVPLLHVGPVDGKHNCDELWAGFSYDAARGETRLFPTNGPDFSLCLPLRGAYQAANATAALGALSLLEQTGAAKIPPLALKRGLEEARLPGRFQTAQAATGTRGALVLDVAHNADGAKVLAETLASVFPGKRFTLVVGVKRGHAPEEFLPPLAVLKPRVVATAPPFRPLPAAEVAAAARSLGLEVSIVEGAAEAIEQTWQASAPDEVVVVTGSFYTVGETPPHLRGA